MRMYTFEELILWVVEFTLYHSCVKKYVFVCVLIHIHNINLYKDMFGTAFCRIFCFFLGNLTIMY